MVLGGLLKVSVDGASDGDFVLDQAVIGVFVGKLVSVDTLGAGDEVCRGEGFSGAFRAT